MVARTPAAARAVALGLLGLAGGCAPGVLDPVGPIGSANRTILVDSVAIMLVIVVPVIVAGWAFAFWFRESNTRATYLPDWAYSGRIELVVWSIPLMTIILLGGVSWIGSHELDPAEPIASTEKPLNVQVIALDWKWLFIYPDQSIASVNELYVPVGVPVHFSLTSASVMNAFFVPRLGSMIYTMNGMTTQLNLQANQAGTYMGMSSHFSGDGFPGMHFNVHAVPRAKFDAWAGRARSGGPDLTRATYAELARQSLDVAPFTYRTAERGLFDAVVRQIIAPGEGPPPHPSREVSPRQQVR